MFFLLIVHKDSGIINVMRICFEKCIYVKTRFQIKDVLYTENHLCVPYMMSHHSGAYLYADCARITYVTMILDELAVHKNLF